MAAGLPSRRDLFMSMQPVSVADLTDSTCGICLDKLADGANAERSERAVLLHGTHLYGEHCIRRWLQGNDSCPHCREQVHNGNPYDMDQLLSLSLVQQSRHVVDLYKEAYRMRQRTPSIESPIDDYDVFYLLSRLRRLGQVAVNPKLQHMPKKATLDLYVWRSTWYQRTPACFNMAKYTPYTRIEAISASDLNARLVVRAEEAFLVDSEALKEDYLQSTGDALNGYPLNVTVHPLALLVVNTIYNRVRRDAGQSMTGSAMALRVRDALESHPRLGGLMRGDRDDLPAGLQGFCEDIIARVVQGLVRLL